MLENIWNAITRLPIDRLWRNLDGHIPSCSRHVCHVAVAMATAHRCLATAHWTFCSYGRLEAERVNQFWWNLVHNGKFGPQWQPRDQILKFLKFKMADGRHVEKYSKCHNSPTNWSTVTQLGWSHSIMFSTCPPWCGCHRNGRCLATAHWTFCSYGRLEAERVNQFRWNLVHNSTFGPQ